MNNLVEALRLEGDRRVCEKEMTFGNGKSREDRIADDLCHQAASRISQQDAELERMRREVEEAKEFRSILEGHLSAAIDDYNDALKALEPFSRVAEHDIGESEADSDFFMPMKTYNRAPLLTVGDFRNALALRAKAEETRT